MLVKSLSSFQFPPSTVSLEAGFGQRHTKPAADYAGPNEPLLPDDRSFSRLTQPGPDLDSKAACRIFVLLKKGTAHLL
jgi:hypothetical protein